MSILMILAGIALGGWAANSARTDEFQRAVIFTGPIGIILMRLAQLGGLALLVGGVILLFS